MSRVGGLFGHRGRFKLPMSVAGALKGPMLIIVHRILRRQSWPLSVSDFSSVLLGDYLFILVEDFYIEPASLKTSPPLGVPCEEKSAGSFTFFWLKKEKKTER